MQNPVHCLWSGGWDSSFRVLQLALIQKVPVQTYYVFDRRRKSTSYEIEAIRRMVYELGRQFPSAAAFLEPVRIINKSMLKKDPDTKAWHDSLNRKYRLGIQYEWFARICRQWKIHDLEVGFIRHPESQNQAFNELLESNITGREHSCKLQEHLSEPALELVRDFRFPIIHLTKEEMGEIAREHGFYDVLSLSWYCYDPGVDGMPCGECRPCQIAGISDYEHGFRPNSHTPGYTFRFPFFKKAGYLSMKS